MRLQSACAVVSVLALLGACTQEAEPPAEAPVEPVAPAATTPAAPPVTYACESGQSVTAVYAEQSTARVTYKGQTHDMTVARSASGARYTGNGLEWWTANRNGVESGTLSRLGPNEEIGTTVLERCSRPSATPDVLPPGAVPPAAGVQPVAAPCKGPQLRLSTDGGDAGMGHRVTIVGVQNIGTQACSLTGYPTVVLQDRQNRNLTTVRSDQKPGSYLRTGEAPAPVELAPQAKAFFDLAWTVVPNEAEGEKTCPTAGRIRMTAPGDTAPVSLAQVFTPCGGRIDVSPFRSEAEPAT